jgi:small subunit ribosomal protein S4
MSKVVAVKSRKCRSYGINLWGRANDAFIKKPYYPGQHKTVRRYGSDFGKQNLKVQKLKAYYVLTEKQLKLLARKAVASLLNPVQSLTINLETMIYVVAYRAGFAPTIFLAKQLASHGHLYLNGKKVTVKSIKMKVGDVLQLSTKAREIPAVKEFFTTGGRKLPDYLEVSKETFAVTLKKFPTMAEVPFESEISISSAIEFYSR